MRGRRKRKKGKDRPRMEEKRGEEEGWGKNAKKKGGKRK